MRTGEDWKRGRENKVEEESQKKNKKQEHTHNRRVQLFCICHDELIHWLCNEAGIFPSAGVLVRVQVMDHLSKILLCVFVEVADRNTGCQDGIIGVLTAHVRSGLRSQLIELRGAHTLVDTSADLWGEGHEGDCSGERKKVMWWKMRMDQGERCKLVQHLPRTQGTMNLATPKPVRPV